MLSTKLLVLSVLIATTYCCYSINDEQIREYNDVVYAGNDNNNNNSNKDNNKDNNNDSKNGNNNSNEHENFHIKNNYYHYAATRNDDVVADKNKITNEEQQQQQQQHASWQQHRQVHATQQQQQQEHEHEHVKQTNIGQFMLEFEEQYKQQQQQQQQQKRKSHVQPPQHGQAAVSLLPKQKQQTTFDPFYFANLRKLQQQQQQYNVATANVAAAAAEDDDADDDDDVADIARCYKNKKCNKNNNIYDKSESRHRRQQQQKHQQQQQQHQQQQNFVVDTQDARNDFRLQLSDLNDIVQNIGALLDDTHIDAAAAAAATHINDNTDDNSNNNNNLNSDNYNSIDVYNNEIKAEQVDNAVDNTDTEQHGIIVDSKSYTAKRGDNDANLNFAAPNNDADDEDVDDVSHVNANSFDSFDDPDYLNEIETVNDNELGMDLPYGIQNVRKRFVRSVLPNNMAISRVTTYQSLCKTKRVSIPLETVAYEYRPSHYIEVTCAHNNPPDYSIDAESSNRNKNRICSEAGFTCIQLNRTIHLIRRNKAATVECWESEIRIVPSGCECMWPKHNFGDIVAYHDTQKRYSSATNLRPPVADYEPGMGHRHLPLRRHWSVPSILKGNGGRGGGIEVGYEALEVN